MNQRLPVWRHINIGTFDLQFSASIVDLELLTDLVTQLLNATEVQGRYKCPHFDDLSSLFWLAKSLVFAHQSCQKLKMAKIHML